MNDARQAWFAQIMASGLEQRILEPKHVLEHATPEVLAAHLPPRIMGKVLQASLSAGAMTPERILETITPDLMAEHIPHEVLWSCISEAVQRAGIANGNN